MEILAFCKPQVLLGVSHIACRILDSDDVLDISKLCNSRWEHVHTCLRLVVVYKYRKGCALRNRLIMPDQVFLCRGYEHRGKYGERIDLAFLCNFCQPYRSSCCYVVDSGIDRNPALYLVNCYHEKLPVFIVCQSIELACGSCREYSVQSVCDQMIDHQPQCPLVQLALFGQGGHQRRYDAIRFKIHFHSILNYQGSSPVDIF